ncbi:MAG: S8 family serine peptidase [Candidatus Heimdallarchaeaceae archaeon]
MVKSKFTVFGLFLLIFSSGVGIIYKLEIDKNSYSYACDCEVNYSLGERFFLDNNFSVPPGVELVRSYPHLKLNSYRVINEGSFYTYYKKHKDKILFLDENENSFLRPLLLSSKFQMGLFLNGSGEYRYDSNTSIAILDTGIDLSMDCFSNSTLVHWKDFVGEDLSTANDEYANATDVYGHGSSVAAIIAGNSTKNGSIVFTKEIYSNELRFLSHIVGNSSDTGKITVEWEDSNLISVGLYDLSKEEIVAESNTYSNGSFSWSFTYPDYTNIVAFVANYGGSAKTEVNGSISFSSLSEHRGLIPGAKLVILKVLDDKGQGNITTLLDALEYLLTIKEEYKIKIVNLSIGFSERIVAVDEAIDTLAQEGIIPVIAAGNDGTSGEVYSPGSSDYAITVGAVNSQFGVAYYSSQGCECPTRQIKPDILAPGGEMANDYRPLILPKANTNNSFYLQEGTSFSTAFITSVIYSQISGKKWNYTLKEVLETKYKLLMKTLPSFNNSFDGDKDGKEQSPLYGIESKDRVEGWGSYVQAKEYTYVFKENYTQEKIEEELSYNSSSNPRAVVITLFTPSSDNGTRSFHLAVQTTGGESVARLTNKSDEYGNPIFLPKEKNNEWTLEANSTYYLILSPLYVKTNVSVILQTDINIESYIVFNKYYGYANYYPFFPYNRLWVYVYPNCGNITSASIDNNNSEVYFSNIVYDISSPRHLEDGYHNLTYSISYRNYTKEFFEIFVVDGSKPYIVTNFPNKTTLSTAQNFTFMIYEYSTYSYFIRLDGKTVMEDFNIFPNIEPFSPNTYTIEIDPSKLEDGKHKIKVFVDDYFCHKREIICIFWVNNTISDDGDDGGDGEDNNNNTDTNNGTFSPPSLPQEPNKMDINPTLLYSLIGGGAALAVLTATAVFLFRKMKIG